jgi:hypothetical protein
LISGVKEVPKKKPPKCPPIGEASPHVEVVSPLPLSPPQPVAIALIVPSELSGSLTTRWKAFNLDFGLDVTVVVRCGPVGGKSPGGAEAAPSATTQR